MADGVNLIPGVDILVIDDSSPDDTYARLQTISEKHANIRVIRNETRLGFQGNFVNVIRNCRSDYLVISADDDFLVGDGIRRLPDTIAALPESPALISSLFRDGDTVVRGQSDNSRAVRLEEFRNCCSHLPGVILNTRQAQQGCEIIGSMLLDPDNYYPQCCLSFLFLSYGLPCVYLPWEVVATGWNLQSGISRYSTLEGRWKQYQFFVGFMAAVAAALKAEGRSEEFDLAMKQLEIEKCYLFKIIGTGIQNERPEFSPYFAAGAMEYAEFVKESQARE